tara:strand:+ start:251 stop:466 length:216 start_codon:yes stop_codon:yes gene_type:complete
MMDILIYSLIKLRQSDTEHSPLARQAIKRLEKLEKKLNETRTLCRMMQGAEDMEEVRLLLRSMQKVVGHQN